MGFYNSAGGGGAGIDTDSWDCDAELEAIDWIPRGHLARGIKLGEGL